MRRASAHQRSLPTRLAEWIGTLLEWSPVDKLLLGALVVLPFVISYTALTSYLLDHPGIAPYFDRSFLRYLLRVDAILIAGWLVIIAVALWLRGRRPSNSVFVHATAQFFVAQAVFASYVTGLHTSPLMGIILLAATTFGLLLFEKSQVLPAVFSFLLGVVGTTLAEQVGVIPYAPALAASPFADGRLAGSWLVSAGAISFVGLLATLGLISFVIGREHARELQLTHTSKELASAMDLISRYVAGQVAEQIRRGNYDAVDRHERRRLTIFFSDIEDFSEIADRVEPEDLSRTLNDYLSAMTEIAGQHGGTIDKFVGDAIMILFGAPLATTDQDQALRAVRMAIEMQARTCQLRERWSQEGLEETFHVRIGINTGVASVGNFGSKGRMDYTAIGRQVNLAARLEAQCERDKILIAHSTWVLVRDAIHCVPKGEMALKGSHHPIKVYEVARGIGLEQVF